MLIVDSRSNNKPRTGLRYYFGSDEWEAFAPGLEAVEDATKTRDRLDVTWNRGQQAPLSFMALQKYNRAQWERLLVGHAPPPRNDVPDEFRELLRKLDEKLGVRPASPHQDGPHRSPDPEADNENPQPPSSPTIPYK